MRRKPEVEHITEVIRLGKDEINLVEYPFASLSKTPGAAIIEHTWETKHPVTGKSLTATWRVEGSAQVGLPTPTDERVYLVLMELTREAGFTQEVRFSRYDVLKRLGWPDKGDSYKMLRDSLRRLNSVTITSENAFWNPEARAFVDIGFHIIDQYEIVAGKPGRKSSVAQNKELPFSYFVWSNVLMASFRNGQIRSLDLGFALSLHGPIALRLYRYLDKKIHDGKSTFEIEVSRLCELHLGMTSATYTSTLKTRLQPAHDELLTRGFLQGARYEPMKTRKGEKVCYTFPSKRALPAAQDISHEQLVGGSKSKSGRGDGPAKEVSPASEAPSTDAAPSNPPIPDLLQRLLGLKISPDVANELLISKTAAEITLQLDCLKDRKPKDAAAVFVKAVRENWAPPATYDDRQRAAERAKEAREDAEAQKAKEAAQEAAEREKTALQEQEAGKLDTVWEKLDPRTRERLDGQVRDQLGANEFLRARLEAGKLTPESPDWVQARHAVLREMLGKAGG